MSQADELLDSLSYEEISSYALNSTIEKHIVIGNDRHINIPESLQRIAVQYDHNIETVTFDCPRYWDNTDLSELHIYINYIAPNDTKGRYLAKNVRVNAADSNLINFDWTITKEITLYNGSLQFLICAVKTDSEANEEIHWNTEINNQMYISTGLECKDVVLEDYPDVINDIFTRLDTVIADNSEIIDNTNEVIQNNEDILNKREEILARIDEGLLEEVDNLNIKVTELETENARLRDDINSFPTIAATGETITIEGASEARFKKFKMDGVSTQETTPSPDFPSEIKSAGNSGNIDILTSNINLFNSKLIDNNDVITINDDGSITMQNNANEVGFIGVKKTLKQLCPMLNVNDKVYLNLKTTNVSEFILMFNVDAWYHGEFKIITQEMLDSRVILYGGNNNKIDTLKIQITLDKFYDYEPHKGSITTFSTSEPLRSLPNGISDTIESDGIHKRVGVKVLDGSENWLLETGDSYFEYVYSVSIGETQTGYNTSLCTHFKNVPYAYQKEKGAVGYYSDFNHERKYFCTDKSTLDEWKAWLTSNPITLHYALAEETIEPFTEEQQVAYNKIKNELKSYKGVTHIYSTNDISPIFDVEVLKDQQTENEKLQTQIDEIKQLINVT